MAQVREKQKPYQFTIRVAEADWIKLTYLADNLHTPRATLVTKAIANYLARFYPDTNSKNQAEFSIKK